MYQVRTVPAGVRNGLEVKVSSYVYRGDKPLEVECPYECPGGCGRRLETLQWGACAVCRGTKYYEPGKCQRCGYKPGGRNCKTLCGEPR